MDREWGAQDALAFVRRDRLRAVRRRLRRGHAAERTRERNRRGARRGRAAGDIPEIGVGMLGYAFMGKAHSNAFRKIAYMTWPPPLVPRLVSIAGRNEEAVREAAERYGYERWTTDWHDLVSDPAIGLFDNGGPNSLHAEPTIAAAEAGKHVLCEKPLGRDGRRELRDLAGASPRPASSTSARSTTASSRRSGSRAR